MDMWFILAFLAAAVLCFGLTPLIRKISLKYHLVAAPRLRDLHKKPVPRLGGLAIAISFLVVVWLLVLFRPSQVAFIPWKIFGLDKHILGVTLGVLILVVIGIIDDLRGMRPLTKLTWQVIAALAVIASGVGIDYLANPFGSPIYLNSWKIAVFTIHNTPYFFTVWSDLFIIGWLVLLVNVVNWLDGLDGLAAGITVIAAIVLFLLSNAPPVSQIATATLALILAGSALGFLPWNFYPAKIFMGDTGSMVLGFILGVLAIVSGGKVATVFLVLGVAIFDAVWVVARRLVSGQPIFAPDRQHLHHRLLSLGFSQRQVVLFLYFVAAIFGIIALSASTPQEKMKSIQWLGVVALAMVLVIVIVSARRKWKNRVA